MRPNRSILSQTHPAELVLALAARHMVTSLVLLDARATASAWTFLADLFNRPPRKLVLILRLAPGDAVVVLLARFAFVPGDIVPNAVLEAAGRADEDGRVVVVDLAGFAP